MLIDLLRRLEQEFSQLRDDPKKVAARADSLCLQRGQTLTLDWSNRKVTGVCRGIAADGAILLETPTGDSDRHRSERERHSANAPAKLRNTVATLRDHSGRQHDRTQLLVELLHHLEQEFVQLSDDPKSVAARADSLCSAEL